MHVNNSTRFLFITLLLLFFSPASAAQPEKYTISGYITEEETGEFSIGALVYIRELGKGTATNQYGFYSLTVEGGDYHLMVSYLGFEDHIQKIMLDKDLKINIAIKGKVILAEEVVVTGEKKDQNVQSTKMGAVTLSMEKVKNLPVLMGEVDVLKTIQLIPGVQSAGDGNAGFYVRGGGPDQNLILLDEAVVYNPSHLLGFFSVFNADAVQNISLIKGSMPSNFGGRLASVLDISMKEGNNKRLEVDGGIGVIASRLTVQGPIVKDTSSFIVSARRTYIDILSRPLITKKSPFYGSKYYFYDLTTKFNYRLSQKDRLFLSGYFGRDRFTYNNTESGVRISIPWGNATTSLRWNHLFNDKLFVNTSAIFSEYQFEFGATQSEFEFRLFSGIRDLNAKVDFSYFPNIRNSIKFGANYIFHRFIPTSASARSGEIDFETGEIIKLYAHDAAVYVSDEFDLTEKIKLNAGVRYSYFQHTGPFDRFVKNELGQITDTVRYGKGANIKDYGGLEPRVAIRIGIDDASSVKAGFTQNYQYIHMASLSSVSLPTDVWVPSTSVVKPQAGTQYALGYFRNFHDNMFETSTEIYYKTMQNLLEYKEGALPEDNVKDNPDNNFTFGSGKSYGMELFLKKRTGHVSGWLGYTLAWTTRTFPDINSGKTFFAKYDRRHDVSVVASYELNKEWSFSGVFVYATGNAATLPVARYVIEGKIVNEYGERNAYRMAPYHRMDVSATYTPDRTKKAKKQAHPDEEAENNGLRKKLLKNYKSSWTFSIYNLYNRHNPYFIYFENDGDINQGSLNIKARQVSLFPILPSVTWNFTF